MMRKKWMELLLGASLAGSGALTACTLTACTLSVYASEAYVSAACTSDQSEEQTDKEQMMLPAYYDARNDGKKPLIRSQGTLGTCWALSCVSALEASLLPEQEMVFSADHLSLNNGFAITQKDGGDYFMIMAYLSGQMGPVLEEEDPYGDGVSAEHLLPRAYVRDMRLLKGMDTQQFQEMIYRYGPVQTSLCMDRKMTAKGKGYYRKDTCAFYCSEEKKPTHDILILGWDDEFPKEAFAKMPEKDGAFICQNTWGDDFGDGGIFYVSYEDANIAKNGMAYIDVSTDAPGEHLYQNDVCGWQGRQGYDTDICWFANVYTANGPEVLKAVGFYAIQQDTDYTVYIAHDCKTDLLRVRPEKIADGKLDGIGYFTVDIKEEVLLQEGERFAVIVKAHTPEEGKQAAVEMKHDSYTEYVTTDGRESYISADGNIWENTQEYYGTNVCLKVFTDSVGEDKS